MKWSSGRSTQTSSAALYNPSSRFISAPSLVFHLYTKKTAAPLVSTRCVGAGPGPRGRCGRRRPAPPCRAQGPAAPSTAPWRPPALRRCPKTYRRPAQVLSSTPVQHGPTPEHKLRHLVLLTIQRLPLNEVTPPSGAPQQLTLESMVHSCMGSSGALQPASPGAGRSRATMGHG